MAAKRKPAASGEPPATPKPTGERKPRARSKPAPSDDLTTAAIHELEKFVPKVVHRSQINEAAYNPRYMPDSARRRLSGGLGKLGLLEPLVWNERTGNLVGGHQRLSILDAKAKSKNYRITVSAVDLSPAEERAANVLLNNPEAQGQWDFEKFEAMVTDKDDPLDLEAAGLNPGDVFQLFGEGALAERADDSLEKLSDQLKELEGVADGIKYGERDQARFYVVFVFENTEETEAALEELGVKDPGDVFQDGRDLMAIVRTARASAARTGSRKQPQGHVAPESV